MKHILTLIFLFFISCSIKTEKMTNSNQLYRAVENNTINNKLEPDTIILTLEYYGWGCPCPQWIKPENKIIYESLIETTDSNNNLDVFWNIIPANDSVKNPFELTDNMEDLIFEFTGQFYVEPEFLGDEGEQGPAKTFLYYSVKHKE